MKPTRFPDWAVITLTMAGIITMVVMVMLLADNL